MLKKYGEKTDNPSIRICINKIENKIKKTKTWYYFDFLTAVAMKLLRSTKSKIGNVKNVQYLKTNEVALVHCNIVSKIYQQSSRLLCVFLPNKSLVIY